MSLANHGGTPVDDAFLLLLWVLALMLVATGVGCILWIGDQAHRYTRGESLSERYERYERRRLGR